MGATVASHELIINIDWNVDFDGALLVQIEARCEVCLRYFTKSLRATVFMQTVYSTVVRGYSNWVCDKGVNLTNKERV